MVSLVRFCKLLDINYICEGQRVVIRIVTVEVLFIVRVRILNFNKRLSI